MKKSVFILVLMFFVGITFGQDIILDFTGEVQATGNCAALSSLTIDNLTQGGSVDLGTNTSVNITTLVGIETDNFT